MLKTPATFPFAGSTGFLAPQGERVRILRLNMDGTALVEFLVDAGMHGDRDASGNREVQHWAITETREEAQATTSDLDELTDARAAQVKLLLEQQAFDRASAFCAMHETASPGALSALVGLGLARQANLPVGGDSRRRTSHYWLTPAGRALAANRHETSRSQVSA